MIKSTILSILEFRMLRERRRERMCSDGRLVASGFLELRRKILYIILNIVEVQYKEFGARRMFRVHTRNLEYFIFYIFVLNIQSIIL